MSIADVASVAILFRHARTTPPPRFLAHVYKACGFVRHRVSPYLDYMIRGHAGDHLKGSLPVRSLLCCSYCMYENVWLESVVLMRKGAASELYLSSPRKIGILQAVYKQTWENYLAWENCQHVWADCNRKEVVQDRNGNLTAVRIQSGQKRKDSKTVTLFEWMEQLLLTKYDLACTYCANHTAVFSTIAAIHKRFKFDLQTFEDLLVLAFPAAAGQSCVCPLLPSGIPAPLRIKDSHIDCLLEFMTPECQVKADVVAEKRNYADKEAQAKVKSVALAKSKCDKAKGGKAAKSIAKPQAVKVALPAVDTDTVALVQSSDAVTYLVITKQLAQYILKICPDCKFANIYRQIAQYACMVGGIVMTLASGAVKNVKTFSVLRKLAKQTTYVSMRQLSARNSDPDFGADAVFHDGASAAASSSCAAAPSVVPDTPEQTCSKKLLEDINDEMQCHEQMFENAITYFETNAQTLPFDIKMTGALAVNSLMMQLMPKMVPNTTEAMALALVLEAVQQYVLETIPAELEIAFKAFFFNVQHNADFRQAVEHDGAAQVYRRAGPWLRFSVWYSVRCDWLRPCL